MTDDKTSMFQRRVRQEPLIAEKFATYDKTLIKMEKDIKDLQATVKAQGDYLGEFAELNQKLKNQMKFNAELEEHLKNVNEFVDRLATDIQKVKTSSGDGSSVDLSSIIDEIANMKTAISKIDTRLFKKGI
jgi:methyl-accepting chemotaxis protein